MNHRAGVTATVLAIFSVILIWWPGGQFLYGNRAAVERLRPDQCESISVCGARKAVYVADAVNRVPLGDQTLSSIRVRLLAKFPALAPLAP